MKKNLKRWLALLLAITMIVTSGAFTNLTYLRATDSETPEAAASAETQQETKTEEKEKEKKQEVKVEAKDDKAAEEAKKAEEAAKADEQKKAEEAAKADEQKAKESATTEEAQQSNEETKTEETVTPAEAAQEDQKAEESAKEENKEQAPEQSQVEETAPEESKTEEAEVKTYEVKIEKPSVDGGSVKIWSDGDKADASNGGTQTVKEGETFYLQIATKEGYSVEQVTDQDGKTIDAKDIKDNTYSYELNDVKENKTLNISYKEEKQDEVTYPAFNHKDSKDGVTANISAPEGVFPEGTTVELKALSADDRAAIAAAAGCEASDVLGLDITFKYEGKEIQPTGDVKVSFSADEIKDADEASVYHVNDGGSVDKIGSSKDGASVGFTADSFSPYAVVAQQKNDVQTQTTDNYKTVEVGSSITITGQGGYSFRHEWSSTDNSIVSISENYFQCTVTGMKTGTVTITHKYRLGNYTGTDTFIIEVTAATPSINLSPATASLTYKGQTTRLTATLNNMAADSIVTWESSDTSVATVNGGVVTAVGSGTTTITATAHPDDDALEGQTYTATATVTVTFSSYNLYYYALIPGMSDSGSDSADNRWLGMGVTEISGVPNPATLSTGVQTGLSYNVTRTVKTLYPDITIDNKQYKYAEKGSENSYSQGYYTLEPYRLVISDGANAGNNGYNPTVGSGNTYHLDHTIVLNEQDYRTVTFNVKYPGETEFASLTDYAQRVKNGTSESTLNKPSTTAVPTTWPYDGVTYQFQGWYTDEACTQSATFSGSITVNKAYYAKYEPINQKYTVEYYYEGTRDDSKTDTLGPITIGNQITSFNDKVKPGYEFEKVDTLPLTISANITDNVIKVYYVKKRIGYTVNYYLNGTQTSVATAKSGRAKFEEVVNESPKDIAGYTIVPAYNHEQSIRMSANASENVINFYYYKNVTLTANSAEKPYNGQKQSVAGYTSSEKDANFGTITVGAEGIDAKEYPVTFEQGVVGTIDATGKYFVAETKDGKLTITKRSVTLTSETASKPYDGTALTRPNVTGGEGFVAGEVTDIKATGSVTNVSEGEVANTITYRPVEGKFNADNYDITKDEGTLSILPIRDKVTVTIVGNTNSEKYDGAAKAVEGYKVTDISNSLYKEADIAFDGTARVERVDADTYLMGLAASQFTNTNGNFNNVEFVVTDGSLTINPRKVTLTSGSDEKVYDGTPLTKDEVTVSGDGFVGTDGAEWKVTGTITETGSTQNEFTYKLKTGTKAQNYDITPVKGTLTVNPSENTVVVTIKGNTDTVTYDGNEHLVSGYTVESIQINGKDTKLYTEKDFKFTGTAEVTKKDAGTYPMGLTEAQFTNKATKNFPKVTFVVTDGSLKINQRDVILTSEGATKPYDGTSLTRPDVKMTGSGFVDGEVSDIRATGSVTEAGEKVDNKITYTTGAAFKESNYAITKHEGKLEITKGDITNYVTLTTKDVVVPYDGESHAAGTATATDKNGNVLTIEYSVDGTTWTKDPGTITAVNVTDSKTIQVRVSGGENYAGYVTGTQVLTITKRSVTLTSATDQKTYDGTPLTRPNVTVSGDGFVDGEVSDITANGSVTYVEEGEILNNITYTTGGNFKESNYDITINEGKLHIEPITTQIIVTAKSGEKVYDGKELTKPAVTYTANVLLPGDKLVPTVSGSQTDVGSSENVVTGVKVMRGDRNVTANYTFGESQKGTLTVKPRKIELTSGSAEKTYDGTPLTNNKVTVTSGSFATGEEFVYDVTGSQTYVGNSKNIFTYSAKSGTTTKLTNYDVTVKYGTLNVKHSAEQITITAPSGSKKYDGTPLTLTSGATYTGKLAKGDVLKVTLKGSQKDYGESDVTVDSYKVVRTVKGVETDVTKNYQFGESIKGTVKITKRNVKLTSGSGNKTYDGTPLTNSTVTVSGDGFVKGEGATYDVTGSQLDAGESDNTFSYTLDKNTKAENYVIETEKGKLTVSQIKEKTITITANSANKTYDGTPLTDNGYTYTEGVLVNGDVLTAVVEGSVTNVDDANNSNVVTSYKVMRDDTDVTKNYTFTASVNGTLTINPRSIKLTSATDEKSYDGTPLTNKTITVSDPGFVAGEGAIYDVTGTQTLVGFSDNTFTYKLKDNTKAANYTIEIAFGRLTVTDDKVNPKTVVTKTHADKADGGRYDLGEIVTFTITVTNPYDTAKTITLTEQGGVALKDTVFENVAPGATVSTTATYKITEEDVKAGNYHNEVTAAFSDGKTFTGTDDVDPEDGKAHLKVIKAVVGKKDGYALGEEVKYSIYVKNDGNLTVEGVKVRDELTGDILDFGAIAGHTQSEPQEVIYTITEEDIVRGSVQNVATVTEGKDPSGKKPESEDGTETVTTEDIRNELVVEKVADQKTNVKAGDEITYTIKVTNNGNVTVKGLTVADTLTGDTFKPSLFDRMTLAPGAFKTFTVTYTVTEADLIAGEIVNVATATAKDPKNTEVTGSDTETVTTTQAIADYTVEKTVDNPQNEYKVGDVIHYTITVTNTGTMTLNNLVIKDQMQGTNGEVVIERQAGVRINGTTAIITKLAAGASIELKASYTVVRADADSALSNRVNVTTTDKSGTDPENPNAPEVPSKSDETDPTPTEKTYVLTIHYVDNNGNAVAPDYTARLLAGETIDAVVSPAIDGYTPNFGTVVLPATGMPAANITVTVIYTPDGPDEVLDDPENPNRPNNGGNNGGGNAVNNNNNNANNANNADNGNNAANNNAGQADANPAPADGVIQPDDNGGYDLTPVEDTPTPLANMNLDDHACCILHFLIMLLTLIIFALYTKSRKNRQLKVEELREQLAIASIQKELDLSDEDMAKYLEEAKKLAEEKKQANA